MVAGWKGNMDEDGTSANKIDSFTLSYSVRCLKLRGMHAPKFPKSIGANIISESAGDITGKYSGKCVASSRRRNVDHNDNDNQFRSKRDVSALM